MKRDNAQLRQIAEQFERRMSSNHPGLGAIMVLFDSNGDNERPVAILLHGIHEESAVVQLRRVIDLVTRARENEEFPIVPTGPILVKPQG